MTDSAQSAGGTTGFDPSRVLRVPVELRRQLARPSNLVVLGFMAALPCLLAPAVSTGKVQVAVDAQFLSGIATQSGLNFTVFALFTGSQFALTLLVAYLFGESVTRESHWSYLPVLLTTPISRGRFLRQKALACGLFSLLGLVIFACSSLAVGLLLYGAGPLAPVSGPHLGWSAMWWRLLVILAYIAIYLVWIATLALLLSVVAGDNGVLAVGGTAAIALASHLFGGLATLGDFRAFLPTRNFDGWLELTQADLYWPGLYWGVFLSLLYGGIFASLAYFAFRGKDIHSGR